MEITQDLTEKSGNPFNGILSLFPSGESALEFSNVLITDVSQSFSRFSRLCIRFAVNINIPRQFKAGLNPVHQFHHGHRDRPHNATGIKGMAIANINHRQGRFAPIESIFECPNISLVLDLFRQGNESKKFSHGYTR